MSMQRKLQRSAAKNNPKIERYSTGTKVMIFLILAVVSTTILVLASEWAASKEVSEALIFAVGFPLFVVCMVGSLAIASRLDEKPPVEKKPKRNWSTEKVSHAIYVGKGPKYRL